MDYSATIASISESTALVIVVDPKTNEIVGKGSGFIFPRKGLLVTCNHVVLENHQIKLRFLDESEDYIDAKVVLRDIEHDLALLKFEASSHGAKPLKLFSKDVRVGMPVIFAGYPLSLLNLTAHQGILSAIVKDPIGSTVYLIDGTVNRGNSGGPLMSAEGSLIGIVNATRRENAPLLRQVEELPADVFKVHGLDLIGIQKALIQNLQLGMGYAVPASYIPDFKDKESNVESSSASTESNEATNVAGKKTRRK